MLAIHDPITLVVALDRNVSDIEWWAFWPDRRVLLERSKRWSLFGRWAKLWLSQKTSVSLSSFHFQKQSTAIHVRSAHSLSMHPSSRLCRSLDLTAKFTTDAWIERIVILGHTSNPQRIVIHSGDKQAIPLHHYQPASHVLVIRRPGPPISSDWKLILSWGQRHCQQSIDNNCVLLDSMSALLSTSVNE